MNQPDMFSVRGCRKPFNGNLPKVETATPAFEFGSTSKRGQLYFLHVSNCWILQSWLTVESSDSPPNTTSPSESSPRRKSTQSPVCIPARDSNPDSQSPGSSTVQFPARKKLSR